MNSVVIDCEVRFDPDARTTHSGKAITNFKVGVLTQTGQVSGFYTVLAWEELADWVSRHVIAGSRLRVEGRLSQRQYINKHGDKENVIEIVADNIRPASEVDEA